jgi:hypothetical protein
MVNKKILVSRCSYSIDDGVDYGSVLKNHHNMDVEVIAVAGQKVRLVNNIIHNLQKLQGH